MLKSLQIENFALIDKLEIDFCKKFNVLSGETGAGKSIIIDALNFVIGGKTLKSLIKENCDYMKVQAVFSCPKLKEVKDMLTSFDAYDENEIIIVRKMQKDGRVDCRINGSLVNASMLKNLTVFLIDIHGQHEHQKLLQDKNHLSIIDGFLTDKTILNGYKEYYEKLKDINLQINKLNGSTQNQERILDLYSYQIDEIENAKLYEGEDDELTQKRLIIQNSEKIFEMLSGSLENLNGSNSAVDNIKHSVNNISSLTKFDSSLQTLADRLESCKFELLDIISSIKEKLDECDFSKEEFEQIDVRLDKIKLLKKKYGPSLSDVFAYLNKIKKEYEEVLNSKDKLVELLKSKEEILKATIDFAKKLSFQRQIIAKEFEDKVKKQLSDLGMKNSKFVVKFGEINEDDLEKQLSETGIDYIKFMFSANIGQNLKPLSEIISGGEASRFMLAIKNIVADVDNIPSMVFDEIDTGISGEMGYMVACKMANISRNHQIMVVSHLPQICAMADENLQVIKYSNNEQTKVEIKKLNLSETLNEIARLSGGIKDNEISLEHARELKNRCNAFKLNLKN